MRSGSGPHTRHRSGKSLPLATLSFTPLCSGISEAPLRGSCRDEPCWVLSVEPSTELTLTVARPVTMIERSDSVTCVTLGGHPARQ